MTVVQCKRCGMRMIPRTDGSCPSCGQSIVEETTAEGSRDQTSQTSELKADTHVERKPENEPEDNEFASVCARQLNRTDKGNRLVTGAILVVIGTLICCPLNDAVPFAFLLTFFGAEIACRMFREARLLRSLDARIAIKVDTRAPVLYLRSFRSDGSLPDEKFPAPFVARMFGGYPRLFLTIYAHLRPTHEERLVKKLSVLGPVVAIGHTQELGAYRLPTSDENWRETVTDYMDCARLVVLRHEKTSGLLWEFNTMKARLPPEKIVIFFEPPNCVDEEFLSQFDLPSIDKGATARFLYFDETWRPSTTNSLGEVLTSKKCNSVTEFSHVLLSTIAFVAVATTILVLTRRWVEDTQALRLFAIAAWLFGLAMSRNVWRRAKQLNRSPMFWWAVFLLLASSGGTFIAPLVALSILNFLGLAWRRRFEALGRPLVKRDGESVRFPVTCNCGTRMFVTGDAAGTVLKCQSCLGDVAIPSLGELRTRIKIVPQIGFH